MRNLLFPSSSACDEEASQRALVAFASFACSLGSFYLSSPVREEAAVFIGTENLPVLFMASLLATSLASPLTSSLVKRKHGLQKLFFVLSFIMLVFSFLYLTVNSGPIKFGVSCCLYLWLGIQSLCSQTALWSICSGCFSNQQAQLYYGRISAGATLGQLVASMISVAVSRSITQGGQSLLLLSSSIALATAGHLSSCLVAEPHEMKTAHKPVSHIAETIASVKLIASSRFLSLNAISILLGSSISATTYLIRTTLLATRIKSASDRGAYVGALNSVSGLLIFILQMGITSSLIKSFGLSATMSTGPFLSIIGMALITYAPVPSVVALIEIIRKVSGHALTRPSREVLFTIASSEERLGSKFLVDMLLQRLGDAIAASMFEASQVKLGLGVRSLSLSSLILALCSLMVAQWLVTEYQTRLKKCSVLKADISA